MSTILTSSVLTVFISALVAFFVSERKLAADNILQERKNWRDSVRVSSKQLVSALLDPFPAPGQLALLHLEISLMLNPHDVEDQAILNLIVPQAEADLNGTIAELEQRIALLLKHDWERAKRETSLRRMCFERAPERLRFNPTMPLAAHDYANPRFERVLTFLFGTFP